MTNLLVADPYFPYAFPYVYDYHLEHGAFPLPETEEDGDEEAAPILVQLAPPDDVEFVVEGIEEEEEDPEEPEEDSAAPIAPPENEDLEEDPEEDPEEEEPMEIWGNEGSDGESESDDEEEPGWLGVVPDIMDIASDTGDVPPPPVETDIGPYNAQFPNTF
ncbi:hypothetical protein RHMOL_Rhmol01G0169800 [Rhododendron molle]|uniref:Uncharacterized protein n=1 Tax=Rhododendron molle TaxID=49168 RepID=A0ACC0Q5B7_RHOML|nr:hypothetical protein RHMOL_Rhmol01G0169800 [Rhododendron molle]